MLLGVDVGGTFTDAVVFDGLALHTAKAPTTPEDQSRGVLAAVDAALERAGAGRDQVEAFAHGMTVGTNALLEERGARTALVATDGFTDLLDIARQNRPDLYRLCAPKPAPLVDEGLRFGAKERIGPDGPWCLARVTHGAPGNLVVHSDKYNDYEDAMRAVFHERRAEYLETTAVRELPLGKEPGS